MKSIALHILILISLLITGKCIHAQELPPRPMVVYTHMNMNFGTFIAGLGGGTVTITPQGVREKEGDIFLVNAGNFPSAAIYRVEALPGNIINMLIPPLVTLNGDSGGQITLQITGSDPQAPYVNTIMPPYYMEVKVGGRLTIPVNTPSGNYNGSYTITFIQE